jgi:hypothetical protein
MAAAVENRERLAVLCFRSTLSSQDDLLENILHRPMIKSTGSRTGQDNAVIETKCERLWHVLGFRLFVTVAI